MVLLILIDSTLISPYFVVLCLNSFLYFLPYHWYPPRFILYLCTSPFLCFFFMFFLSIRVLICPRSLFNCFICASILLFHHGFIPVLFLFLTPNMSLTTAAPAYTQSFSSVIFPNLVLSITSTNFLVASNNLCFSIPLSGGNLSLVSFNKTLYIFSSMLVSSIVISYSFLLQKHGFFPPQHLVPCSLVSQFHILS